MAPMDGHSPLSTEKAGTPTPTIPQKRAHEEHQQHQQQPIQPIQQQSTYTPQQPQQPQQAQQQQKMPPTDIPKAPIKVKPPREKKDSWKKKEAAASLLPHGSSASGNATAGGSAGAVAGDQDYSSNPTGKNPAPLTAMPPPALQRWRLPKPQIADYEAAKPPVFTPSNIAGADIGVEFYMLSEHPKNRRGFRYVPCKASHTLPLVSYRLTEVPPFQPRFNFEDMNAQVHITEPGTIITTEKGFRMARANVGVREGNWYFECRILRGIDSPGIPGPGGARAGDAHVRIGWARREAPLDAPVGFDAYSYGLRDQDGQKIHMSRPRNFMHESFVTGDIIGLQIHLPPLSEQRKDLLSTISNPTTHSAVAASILKSGDIVRDRIPIRYKNQLYFEQFEYQPTKDIEDLMNPANSTSSSTNTNTTNKPPPIAARTLKGSFIRVYKNGKFMGTPWENLLAFLPPCSKPNSAIGGREVDDGFLGYYPAMSVFRGGAVEVNFGPEFWCPPDLSGAGGGSGDTVMRDADGEGEGDREGKKEPEREKELPRLRPICERYNEQIAEDIVYDLVDEVDLFFTSTELEKLAGGGITGAGVGGTGTGSVGGEQGDVMQGGGQEVGVTEEIKEMEVEDE